MDELRSAWSDKLISSVVIGWDEIEDWHKRGKEFCMRYMKKKYKLVTDVVKEMAWWAAFEKDRKPAYREKAAGLQKRLLPEWGGQFAAQSLKLAEMIRVRVAAERSSRSAADVSREREPHRFHWDPTVNVGSSAS